MIKMRSFFAAVVGCALLIIVAIAQESVNEQQQERTANVVFNYALQVAASGDEIWNGFTLNRHAFLNPVGGNNEIRFTNNIEKKRPSWAVGDDFFTKHSVEDDLVMTFHEAFHGFQRDRTRKGLEWRAENTEVVFEYPEHSARNSALFNIEGRILFSALQSHDVKTLKKKIRQFLTVRRLRQSELEPTVVIFEKDAELNEGLAEYAGTKAVLVGIEAVKQKRISIPFQFRNGNDYIHKKFERLDLITRAKGNIRTKFYDTGAAQGLLLDRLMLNWKTRVQEQGATLQDLLEDVTNSVGVNKRDAVKHTLKQYGYVTLLKEEEEIATKKTAEAQAQLNSLLSQKGQRFVIDVSAMGKLGELQSFDPWNLIVINRDLRVHKRTLDVTEEGYYKANFKQPVVEDRGKKQYITISAPDETQAILIDDVPLDTTKPGEKQFMKKLVITGARFNLEAKAGQVIVNDDEITIKIRRE